ncbi:hypothetical protein B0A52_09193 [Exophiala mesophila]|uniref:Endonuclease/exonuclease/phosphatase domain-containing protein n=1 Tax=Exophiala mesophila TaxID=212818 RepID=A0A438MTH9_EXOME|nr:hypothetical protein B0A52_09193 [Exophiala mesophila]
MGDASSLPPSPLAEDLGSSTSSSSVLPLRIITHNIRYAANPPEESELRWPERFPTLSAHFKYHIRHDFSPPATLVGMQEVLQKQLGNLLSHTFNSSADPKQNDWDYIGVARDDGKEAGEYSPIFYRRSAWKVLHFETVWLNETGEVGKKGWDAASIRILTVGVLESTLPCSQGKTILALNTHLDDSGKVARREGAKIIRRVAAAKQHDFPAVSFTYLSGDLNSPPEDDAYKLLNAKQSGFMDVRRLVPDHEVYGDERTFTGFPEDPSAQGKWRIDFVHLGYKDQGDDDATEKEMRRVKALVRGYAVLPNRFDNRIWMTDHRAVVVDLVI